MYTLHSPSCIAGLKGNARTPASRLHTWDLILTTSGRGFQAGDRRRVAVFRIIDAPTEDAESRFITVLVRAALGVVRDLLPVIAVA